MNRCAELDLSHVIQTAGDVAQRERRVAQAVSERIAYLVRRAGNRFKVAIADEHILLIFHVHSGFRKIGRGRIGRERRRERVRQMAGRADVADQQIRRRQSALHAALPGQQRRTDGGVVLKPERVHHAARVEHHGHARERREHLFDHVFFLEREEVIAVVWLSRAVIILAGKAADRDDGGIGERARLPNQRVIQNRFSGLSRRCARGVLRLDVLGIKAFQRLKNLDFALVLLHAEPLRQRADVGHRRVSASAAALDIVRLRLAENRHAAAALQRQRFVFVFEQHHAFGRRPAG